MAKRVKRSLKSVALAASPSQGDTPKIQNHADRPVAAASPFIPGDEHGAVIGIRGGVEDLGNPAGEPVINLPHRIILRRAGVMAVVA